MKDDGDIIRAYGFLAIYWGNLEQELQEINDFAMKAWPELEEFNHYRFADKARHLRKTLIKKLKKVGDYPHKERDERAIRRILRACKDIAEDRNDYFHGSVTAPKGRSLALKLKNDSRKISSEEVYDLAGDVHNFGGHIFGLKFAIGRLIKKELES